MSQQHMKVAMMTSGGLAPCLSASIAQLVRYWSAALKEGKIASLSIRMYLDGYKGILIGDSFMLMKLFGKNAMLSTIWELTNLKDCIARGFIKENESPLEVAAQQLIKDEINVLHTIGGDDTNTQAAVLPIHPFRTRRQGRCHWHAKDH
ncbi:pyrophosphate--fructose 6-phosphate 1-phosphotransferase [Fragilaria crotonensis]|nr:pyrophosphate--fructose 6-phosphate 1-phosphotransferase [Fragilaria crotonensis]